MSYPRKRNRPLGAAGSVTSEEVRPKHSAPIVVDQAPRPFAILCQKRVDYEIVFAVRGDEATALADVARLETIGCKARAVPAVDSDTPGARRRAGIERAKR